MNQHPSLTRSQVTDTTIGPDAESDQLWSELLQTKQRYEAALAAYLDHHRVGSAVA